MFFVLVLFYSLSLYSQDSTSVVITRISEHCYVHTSFKSNFPSNGLLVVSDNHVMLIDTGWDTIQTLQVVNWVSLNIKSKIEKCVITHFHDDRLAGLPVLKADKAEILRTRLTAIKASKFDEISAGYDIPSDTTFNFHGLNIRTFYPGEGHSQDNIVVEIKEDKVLFGGCLIKSYESSGLGNIADANIQAWTKTVENVIKTFTDVQLVIPGHQKWKGTQSFNRTLDLLTENSINK